MSASGLSHLADLVHLLRTGVWTALRHRIERDLVSRDALEGFVPVGDLVLDTSDFTPTANSDFSELFEGSGVSTGPMQTGAAFDLHLSVESDVDRRRGVGGGSMDGREFRLLVSVGFQGRSCRRGSHDFDPRRMLCPEALSILRSTGRVDLSSTPRLYRVYRDEESDHFRSMLVRMLPDLGLARIIELSDEPPPSSEHINSDLSSVEAHQRWWGEHHGICAHGLASAAH